MTDSIQIMTASAQTERHPPTRPIRAMSLPCFPSSHNTNLTSLPSPRTSPTYPDLPPDPISWSSAHVAAYLTYCLRLYPPAIIKDLSRYVQEDATLNGRRFLRLKEEQLRRMGFNERWIKLIIEGKRALRRENLTQKILTKGDGLVLGEMEEIGEENDIEGHFSDMTSPTLTSTVSAALGKEQPFSNLTIQDKEFIRQELERLRESLQQKSAMSFWRNFSSPTLEKLGLEYLVSFCQSSYGSGLLHGATIGAITVWICMRMTKR